MRGRCLVPNGVRRARTVSRERVRSAITLEHRVHLCAGPNEQIAAVLDLVNRVAVDEP